MEQFHKSKKRKHQGKTPSGAAVGGEGGVVGEGRLGGVPKFHSRVRKRTMTLRNKLQYFVKTNFHKK